MGRSFAVPPEARESPSAESQFGTREDSLNSVRWRPVVVGLVIEQLSENEYAVFNEELYDSTVLNAVDHEIVQIVKDRHASVGEHSHPSTVEVIEAVAAFFGVDVDSNLRQYCERSLTEMETLGLVARANQ